MGTTKVHVILLHKLTCQGLSKCGITCTLREESSQNNVILQYKLLASILSAVCSVIQQSLYVLHFYYTLYDGKYY